MERAGVPATLVPKTSATTAPPNQARLHSLTCSRSDLWRRAGHPSPSKAGGCRLHRPNVTCRKLPLAASSFRSVEEEALRLLGQQLHHHECLSPLVGLGGASERGWRSFAHGLLLDVPSVEDPSSESIEGQIAQSSHMDFGGSGDRALRITGHAAEFPLHRPQVIGRTVPTGHI